MFSKALFPVAALVFSLTTACGVIRVKDTDDELPRLPPAIALNAPQELLGSWKLCNPTADDQASGAIYTFEANGSLLFESVSFDSIDCRGQGTLHLRLKGSFAVGSGNIMDLTTGEKGKEGTSTVYRVFSIQGDRLLISNNAGVGGDKNNRDFVLNDNAIFLTRTH